MGDYRKDLVARWLTEFKSAAEKSFMLIKRVENMATLSKLNLTVADCREVILLLSARDYVSGPDADSSREGNLWVFGKQIGAQEVYIKLKLADIGEKRTAKCISFHVAQHPLRFPWK
ncbi:type II toxin-antitoxin system MqsR family toxin [Candidatus Poribacteria bacterium]|nr:type II toxin-antitoxin system MqsR family toxin [Candidatus Poribacteria bacterium]